MFSPGSFSISAFKSEIARRRGFSRGHFFQCRIDSAYVPVPPTGNSWMLCKAAQLPQSVVEPTELHYFTRPVKLPGRRTFPILTLTFFGTADYFMRGALQRWHDAIYSPESNATTAETAPGQVPAFYGTITLDHYDITGATTPQPTATSSRFDVPHQKIATYTCVNAFPATISPMSFDYDNEEVQTFDVDFYYQYFTLTMPSTTRV